MLFDLQRRDGSGARRWRSCSSSSSRSSATTSDRSLRMNFALRTISSPPMIVDGTTMREHGDARAVRVGQQGRQHRAAGRADEEDVHRAERSAHAAQPVRNDRLRIGPTMVNAREQQDAAGCPGPRTAPRSA